MFSNKAPEGSPQRSREEGNCQRRRQRARRGCFEAPGVDSVEHGDRRQVVLVEGVALVGAVDRLPDDESVVAYANSVTTGMPSVS